MKAGFPNLFGTFGRKCFFLILAPCQFPVYLAPNEKCLLTPDLDDNSFIIDILGLLVNIIYFAGAID